MSGHTRAQELAEAVYLKGRAATLRSLGATLRDLDGLYASDAAEMRKALQELLAQAGVPNSRIKRVIDGIFSASRADRTAIVADAIQGAARSAVAADSKTFKAIFKDEDPGRIKFAQDADAVTTASARIRGKFSADKFSLSRRFQRDDRRVADLMRRQITASVRAGESTTRVAERLLDVGEPIVRLPKHVQDLERAARLSLASGDKNVYVKAAKKWQGTIQRLGATAKESTIRNATEQLVKDLGKAKIDQIDGIVDRWTLERARQQARTIARTEVVDGYRDQYKAQTEDKSYVVGYRWVLSGAHPAPDVCDVYAQQDLHGLGPGGYPPGGVPGAPHPHDLCSQVAIIDEAHFKRARAKRRGTQEPPKPWLSGKTETGEEWLRKQPQADQKRLLGPSRFKAFQEGKTVLGKDGTPIPVHRVLGIAKPKRTLGPAVIVGPSVKRERGRQVKRFPTVAPIGKL